MLRRIIEEGSVEMHAWVLETMVLNRMIVHVDRLKELCKPDADVADAHGRILYEDRLFEKYIPVVETVVHLSTRVALKLRVSNELPLIVDIVDWVRQLHDLVPMLKWRSQQCEFMWSVQWLLLSWAQHVDGEVAHVLLFPAPCPQIDGGPNLNICRWWKMAQQVQTCWLKQGRMLWTATVNTREVIIDPHRMRAQRLSRLLAHRYVLWCC